MFHASQQPRVVQVSVLPRLPFSDSGHGYKMCFFQAQHDLGNLMGQSGNEDTIDTEGMIDTHTEKLGLGGLSLL